MRHGWDTHTMTKIRYRLNSWPICSTDNSEACQILFKIFASSRWIKAIQIQIFASFCYCLFWRKLLTWLLSYDFRQDLSYADTGDLFPFYPWTIGNWILNSLIHRSICAQISMLLFARYFIFAELFTFAGMDRYFHSPSVTDAARCNTTIFRFCTYNQMFTENRDYQWLLASGEGHAHPKR